MKRETAMPGLDQILGAGGTDIGALAARFGLSPDQASSAVDALMPALLGGFQKVDADDLGPVTDIAATANQPDASGGNAILGHIFGSKDVSRQVADHASGQSGVSSTVLKAMLPVIAAMVARHFAASGGGAGALGGLLDSVLGGNKADGLGSTGGLGGALGGMLGGSGGTNPLDAILSGLGRR